MAKKDRGMRDLRAYSRGTFIRLGVGGLVLIFVVGNLLIRWIYGPEAVRLSLSCMFVAMIPAILIGLFLAVTSWIVKRQRDDRTDPD
jgi:hypothetical protein